jgi:hypothetical protein
MGFNSIVQFDILCADPLVDVAFSTEEYVFYAVYFMARNRY